MAGGVWGGNTSQYKIYEDGCPVEIDHNKPPYHVPSMREIEAIPWNGFNVVSTFSGCGGSCLGYRMAGFRVLWANEFIKPARETYKANHKNAIVDERDIRDVSAEDILSAIGMKVGELDLFDGSPPCASFSTAGKRHAGWGQVKAYSELTKQRTDDLFFEYARILGGLQPKVFVAENVSGLVKGSAKGYFKEILRDLRSKGYCVEAKLLDAQWLGVPQMRQRLIFIGVRNDLQKQPIFPSPIGYRYSVQDALPWISHLSRDSMGHEGIYRCDVRNDPCQTIRTASGGAQMRFEVEADISKYAIGREYDNLKEGQKSDRYFNLLKPDINKPCPTITQTGGHLSAASVVHPTERRKFTIAELKRICAFPDDFILTGTYRQQWERLGRAVPPVMMYHIAEAVRGGILCAG